MGDTWIWFLEGLDLIAAHDEGRKPRLVEANPE
jgi:hypothetical protein